MASALSEKEQKKLKRQEKKAGAKPKGEVEVEDGGCINDISVNGKGTPVGRYPMILSLMRPLC